MGKLVLNFTILLAIISPSLYIYNLADLIHNNYQLK